MDFDKIYGLEPIKNILKTSASSAHISHAYIFEGQEGIGRLSCALSFAKAILCENQKNGVPCKTCKSCLMADALTHPDLRIVTNELYDDSASSSEILVGTIREMKKEIYIKPYFSKRKVYIVPNAETISEIAQNSLLKVFEEPPPYCTVILISKNNDMLLDTILSRAVNIKFPPLAEETVKTYLRDNFPGESEETLSVRAAMSGGSIGRAVTLMNDTDFDKIRSEIIGALCALSSSSGKAFYETYRILKGYDKKSDLVIQTIKGWFSDCLLYVQTGSADNISNLDKRNELAAFCSKIVPDAPFYLLDIAVRYSEYIKSRVRYPLALHCMLTECREVLYDRNNRNKI